MALDALLFSLPKRDSTLRMRLWRTLKERGFAMLREGVYVAPAGHAGLGALAAEIRSAGGFALAAGLSPKSAEDEAAIERLFDRSREYGELVERMRALERGLARLGARRGQTALGRLAREHGRLAAIDFFPGEARAQAEAALAALKRRYEELHAAGEPRPARRRVKPLDPARYQARVWATRADPWVDRLASGWLIKRFIDRAARFAWIRTGAERPKRAVGFDFDGAEFTHARNRVTFEVLMESFGLERDPGLAAIAAAVHYLDVGGIPVAEAKGLEAVLRGVKEKAKSDDACLAEAMRIFDHFYKACAGG